MGTAAGTLVSGRGLRYLGGLPSPASAGQPQPEETLPALPPTLPPTPGWGNSLDFKGDQSQRGTSYPGTTFLPLPSLLPVVLFLVTSFPWQQNAGRGGRCWRGRSAGKSLLGTGHIQENNVVGRSRKRVRGEGRSRENREGGGRKAAVASPKSGSRVTLNATLNWSPSPEIPDTAPNPRLRFVGRSVRVAVPTPRTRRCARRPLSDPGSGGGGEAGGSADPGVSLPDAPQRRPSLLGRPFPFPRRESSTSRAKRKGRTEGRTGSKSGVVVQAGRKRGGG